MKNLNLWVNGLVPDDNDKQREAAFKAESRRRSGWDMADNESRVMGYDVESRGKTQRDFR